MGPTIVEPTASPSQPQASLVFLRLSAGFIAGFLRISAIFWIFWVSCANVLGSMPRTRLKSSLPVPPAYYPEASDFYQPHDVITFIRANDSAEKRGVEVRSGVVQIRPGGPRGIIARGVWIMDTTYETKRGVPPKYWRLEHVRVYTVRRKQVLIAKAAFIRGDL
jgi:hypothetical protein